MNNYLWNFDLNIIMPRYRTPPNQATKIIRTSEDVKKMLHYAKNLEQRAVISFLWLTASRVSEMLAVKLNDIYITSSTIKISIPNLRKIKKGEQDPETNFRVLEFPLEGENFLFIDILINYYRYRKQEALENEPLFDRTGRYITKVINEVSQKAYGIVLSPNHLIQARLSYLASRGLSAWELKYIKGVRDMRSIEKYIHTQPRLIKF